MALWLLPACCCLSEAHASDPVKQWGQLQVKGNRLYSQQGQPVALRGVSLGCHHLWPRFYNKKTIQTLKHDWHVGVVRASVGVSEDDNYLENPDFAFACLATVIEAAIKQNLYVIVDWHASEMLTREAKEFFSQVAQRYGRFPNIIYEIYHEPVEDSWANLRRYAAEVIGEIRRYDPDNIILMGCPHWGQDIHLVAEQPLEGVANVMYTVHFFAATHGDRLRERTEEAVGHGIPVFISECGGTEADGNYPIDAESTEQWIKLCERLGISWVLSSLSDQAEGCAMLLPRATSAGPWTDDVMKAHGKLAKRLLSTYNP